MDIEREELKADRSTSHERESPHLSESFTDADGFGEELFEAFSDECLRKLKKKKILTDMSGKKL